MGKKKKTMRKRVTAAKTTAKKGLKKKTAPRKASRKKAPLKSAAKASFSRQNNSVDSILKRYKKERSAQESTLTGLRKKIEDLEAKTEAYRNQIFKLAEKEKSTEVAIESLDSRRDVEVSNLLSRLGVQFNAGASDTDSADSESSVSLFVENRASSTGGGDGVLNEGAVEASD